MTTINALLTGLNVPIKVGTANFREWLVTQFPSWPFSTEFAAVLPSQWTLVEVEDRSLCYLATAELIVNTWSRTPGSSFLPVGSLMDGSAVVIDTLDKERMLVGRVNRIRAMTSNLAELDRSCFRSFEMSYIEWLAHIRDHPEDLRYL